MHCATSDLSINWLEQPSLPPYKGGVSLHQNQSRWHNSQNVVRPSSLCKMLVVFLVLVSLCGRIRIRFCISNVGKKQPLVMLTRSKPGICGCVKMREAQNGWFPFGYIRSNPKRVPTPKTHTHTHLSQQSTRESFEVPPIWRQPPVETEKNGYIPTLFPTFIGESCPFVQLFW